MIRQNRCQRCNNIKGTLADLATGQLNNNWPLFRRTEAWSLQCNLSLASGWLMRTCRTSCTFLLVSSPSLKWRFARWPCHWPLLPTDNDVALVTHMRAIITKSALCLCLSFRSSQAVSRQYGSMVLITTICLIEARKLNVSINRSTQFFPLLADNANYRVTLPDDVKMVDGELKLALMEAVLIIFSRHALALLLKWPLNRPRQVEGNWWAVCLVTKTRTS